MSLSKLACLYALAGLVLLVPASASAQAGVSGSDKPAAPAEAVASPAAQASRIAQAAPASQAGKPGRNPKQALPVFQPDKPEPQRPPVQAAAAAPDALFEEIEFGGALVIEGKVEKPQVQFTLLKEPPPEKEIRFETSFLPRILKQDRDNTFHP